MEYDRIILEMLNRIQALEEEVQKLKKANVEESTVIIPEEGIVAVGKKYVPLAEYLTNTGKDQIRLSFEEIENLLGARLPGSAREHRAFWANTTSHSIALSWLSCNYKTAEVNMEKGTVLFERNRGMRISDYMKEFANDIATKNGEGYKMTRQEICHEMKVRYGLNPSSVIPSDYCYNRVNSGIRASRQTMLFVFDGDGTYQCMGSGYPYSGKIYHRPKGADADVVVGFCENGKREILPEFKGELD